MALETSINICIKNACSTIVFKETTGAYNVTTNPTGYGSPNPTTASVTAAVLKVIGPDDVEYSIDMLAEGFPTTNVDLEYEIPLDLIGNRTVIEDGYWQFIYTVTSTTDYIATNTSIFTCNSQCCILKLLLAINEDSNDITVANKKKKDTYIMAKIHLEALKHYAYCGNLDKFDNIKLIIDKICENSGCDSCN